MLCAERVSGMVQSMAMYLRLGIDTSHDSANAYGSIHAYRNKNYIIQL